MFSWKCKEDLGRLELSEQEKKKIKVTVPFWGKVPTYSMFFKLREYFWSLKSSVYLLGLPNL